MTRYPSFALAACILAACSGNPFDPTEDEVPVTPPPVEEPTPEPEPETDPEPEPTGIDGRGLPPGTNSPTPNTDIVRFEERDNSTGPNRGNGFANNFRYDSDTDTFTVEGLAFDGEQPDGTPYTRALNGPGTLDPGEPILLGTGFAAYEGPTTAPDSLTQTAIGQLEHRAIFKRSSTTTNGEPLTELAIVRTGSYANYGFGGFVYTHAPELT